MATLNSRPVKTPAIDDYLYGINNAGNAEGRVLVNDLLALGVQPNFIRNLAGGTLDSGRKYICSGTAARTLPAITTDGEVITIVRNDQVNDFLVNPDGSDTIEGDPSFNVDVNKTEFNLIANLSGTNWEVYV